MEFRSLWILGLITFILLTTWWVFGAAKEEGSTMNDENIIPGGKIRLSEAEWKERLTPEQFAVLRKGGTEPAYSGKYDNWKEKGIYTCAACELPLFSSDAKYNSGTGWPSFWEPINPHYVTLVDDYFLFIKRVEVRCARCDSHLGHVFNDGPPPTGKRYCMNSVALAFIPNLEVENGDSDKK